MSLLSTMRERLRRDANLRDLVRHSGVMYAGGIVSLALTFAQQVTTAGALGAADYGRLAVILSSGLLVLLLADFRTWELGTKLLARPAIDGDHGESIRIITWLLVVEVVTGLLGTAIMLALAQPVAALLAAPDLDSYIRLYAFSIPFRLIAGGVTGALPRLYNRFDWITFKSITYALVRLVLMSGAAALGFGLGGVVIGAALGEVFNAGLLLWMTWQIRRRDLTSAPHTFDLRRPAAFDAGRRLIVPMWITATLYGVHHHAFIPVLALVTTPAQVGLFRLALDTAELLEKTIQPLVLVVTPRILTLHAADDRRGFARYTRQAALVLLGVSLPLALALLVGVPLLVPRLLDAAFAGVVTVAPIMVAGYAVNVVITPYVRPAMVALGRLRLFNVALFAHSVCMFGVLVTAAPVYGALGAAWARGGTFAVFAVLHWLLFQLSLRRYLLQRSASPPSTPRSVPPPDRA